MEDLDLELDHYSLDDLLRLFKLPSKFTTNQLKAAKKTVFAVHPDKTGLPQEYFLFFLEAYKLLVQVHTAGGGVSTEKFAPEDDADKRAAAERFTKSNDFNGKFNGLFEKVYIKTEDEAEGYGDWLKSNEDLDVSFDSRKRESRSVVVAGVQEVQGSSAFKSSSSLGNSADSYASLKHMYTAETVLGVSEEDFKPTHRTADELKRERSVQIRPFDEREAQQFLNEVEEKRQQADVRRAYIMVKDSLKKEKQVGQFWSHLLQLEN
jgi:hypothetical protein